MSKSYVAVMDGHVVSDSQDDEQCSLFDLQMAFMGIERSVPVGNRVAGYINAIAGKGVCRVCDVSFYRNTAGWGFSLKWHPEWVSSQGHRAKRALTA